jgi:hypothetical protein
MTKKEFQNCIDKLTDRLANTTYSFTHSNEANLHMKSVYRHELPGFLEAITGNHLPDL